MNVRHVHTHIKSAVHPQLWALVVARRTLPDAATSAHCAVLPSYPPQNGVEERCGVLAAFAHASFERLATGQREQGAYAHSHAHTPLGPVLRNLVLDGTPVKSYEALVLGFAALERTLRDVAGPTNDSSRPILRDLLAGEALGAALPPNAASWLAVLLDAKAGLNLRNVVWHGFLAPDDAPHYAHYAALVEELLRTLPPPKVSLAEPLPRTDFDAPTTTEHLVASMSQRNEERARRGAALAMDSAFISEMHKESVAAAWRHYPHHPNVFAAVVLPALEQALRERFVELNGVGTVVAMPDEYYITLDGFGQQSQHDLLLQSTVVNRKAEVVPNALLNSLGPGATALLRDLFMSAAGPNLRARLSHGELDFLAGPPASKPVGQLGDVLLALCGDHAARDSVDSYRAVYSTGARVRAARKELHDALVELSSVAKRWRVTNDNCLVANETGEVLGRLAEGKSSEEGDANLRSAVEALLTDDDDGQMSMEFDLLARDVLGMEVCDVRMSASESDDVEDCEGAGEVYRAALEEASTAARDATARVESLVHLVCTRKARTPHRKQLRAALGAPLKDSLLGLTFAGMLLVRGLTAGGGCPDTRLACKVQVFCTAMRASRSVPEAAQKAAAFATKTQRSNFPT
ncbi:DUF4209 domain-containing protein [Pseudoscourfieldia marina]